MPRKSPELVRLSKRTVDALKPGAVVKDVFDDRLTGFHARVMPSGKITFALRYRDPKSKGGKATFFRFKVGEYGPMTVEQARTAAEDARAAVLRGESPSTDRSDVRESPTVADRLPAYIAHLRRNDRSDKHVGETDRLLTKHVGTLARLKVQEVKRADVSALLAPIRLEHPALTNAVRMALSGFFTWANAEGLRPDETNPVTGTAGEVKRARRRVLSPDERTALATALATCEAEGMAWQAVGIIWLIAHTGMRREEAVQLRWDSMTTMPDGTAVPKGCFHLAKTKTGASIRPVCGPTVAAKLEEFKRLARRDARQPGRMAMARSPYVFPSPQKPTTWYRSLGSHWPTIRERAGLDLRERDGLEPVPALVIHELRHDFRSALGSLNTVEANLAGGWKGEAMSDRYYHPSPEVLTALSERIDAIRAPQLIPKADTTPVVPITGERRTA